MLDASPARCHPACTLPTALVVAANSGVGAAATEAFLNGGWDVVTTFHDKRARLDGLIAGYGTRAQVFQLAVEDHASVSNLFQRLTTQALTLDAIVVVASYNEPRLWNLEPTDATAADLAACFAVELGGLHDVVREGIPLLVPGGAIVTFSSASALHGDPDTFVYNVAKASVPAYVRMIARHYGTRLRIHCIAPDSIATDWVEAWNVTAAEQEQFRVFRGGQKRIGTPQEVADLVFFLCGPTAAFLSGQTITMDGGAG